MSPFLKNSIPALLVGLALGFAFGSMRSGGSSEPVSDKITPHDKAVAALTAKEVSKSVDAAVKKALRARPSEGPRPRPADWVEKELEKLEKDAFTEKKWTRADGLKARHLLTRAPEAKGKAFIEKFESNKKSLTIEEGAWLPGTKPEPRPGDLAAKAGTAPKAPAPAPRQ
jgi:hypothetical protein